MGADAWLALLGEVSVFHFVFGTGGLCAGVAVRGFFGRGRLVSLD